MNSDRKGIIFDIKKYAIHDGPGVRTTVFFKGCPLNCWWCHNPESQQKTQEFFYYPNRCSDSCQMCVEKCPENAIKKNERIDIDKEKCTMCGVCEDVCVSEALKIVGREYSVEELIKEVTKDILFYDESYGGVTISGGEPLMQYKFVKNFLKECKKNNLKITLDTSGFADFKAFLEIVRYVDTIFYDLKLIDEKEHIKYTSVSNKIILENLKKLSALDLDIEIRIPIIPKITDTKENIDGIIAFLKQEIVMKHRVALLPYHKAAFEKYQRLGVENKMKKFGDFDNKRFEEIMVQFQKEGFSVKRGG